MERLNLFKQLFSWFSLLFLLVEDCGFIFYGTIKITLTITCTISLFWFIGVENLSSVVDDEGSFNFCTECDFAPNDFQAKILYWPDLYVSCVFPQPSGIVNKVPVRKIYNKSTCTYTWLVLNKHLYFILYNINTNTYIIPFILLFYVHYITQWS